jgi:hypothetical protein
MEPRHEKPKAPKPRPEEKPKRFRILKLEQRLAPKHGGTSYTGEGSGTFSIA